MFRRTFTIAASSFALFAAPALHAQDSDFEVEFIEEEEEGIDLSGAFGDDGLAGLFGNMFGQAEPLTAEQEARLPAADQVVASIFPSGTYAKMMNESLRPMLDGMMGSFAGAPVLEVSRITGLTEPALAELDEDTLSAALNILDPASAQRQQRLTEVTFEVVTEVLDEIEPSYRAGLARAYAIRFTQVELEALAGFFKTPVGSKYAAESMLIMSDPQVMSAMNELMPRMLGMMPKMIEKIGAVAAEFPEQRSYSDLSAGEQSQLADLLGISKGELREAEPQPVITLPAESET